MVFQDVPQGGLLLITLGSPCQELTSVGPYGGEFGLAGSQSVLYHAVPVVARCGECPEAGHFCTRFRRECSVSQGQV
eukprot:6707086-Lingulodinium_polyedra.AAC.1